ELVPLNGIYSFGKVLKDLNLAEDEDVIFVCAMGQRRATASEIAMVGGLRKVYNLANGMNGWVARRYPIERYILKANGAISCNKYRLGRCLLMPLLEGKKALIFGIANHRSIGW